MTNLDKIKEENINKKKEMALSRSLAAGEQSKLCRKSRSWVWAFPAPGISEPSPEST
jgi:hypothetical protein